MKKVTLLNWRRGGHEERVSDKGGIGGLAPMSKPSVISQLVTYLLSGNESTQSLSSLSVHLYSQRVISRSITPSIILWIHLFIQWVWQRLSTNTLPTFSPFSL